MTRRDHLPARDGAQTGGLGVSLLLVGLLTLSPTGTGGLGVG